MSQHRIAGFFAFASVLVAGSFAHATLTLSNGLVGGSGDVQNVLLTPLNQTGNTIQGELNQSGDLVDFTSDEFITNPAGGQARVEAVDGDFSMIMIAMENSSLGMSKLQFNIDAVANGFADITLIDQFGTVFSFTEELGGNGQNFFTGLALDNQVIVKAMIDTSNYETPIADVQQVRIGVTEITSTPVPEPASVFVWLAVLGVGVCTRNWWRTR